ncbi:MAG TPA: type 1 glutamine amidotransferase domain-containing protein [Kofleriaceae bacterium]|nr:type 1 glutamine amidotransferase domain-containing protein [Kofleriaceae bacterium]
MARIAFILGEDFEDSEFRKPYDALASAGHRIEVLGANAGETVSGKQAREHVKIEAACAERTPDDYDALVIPGGYSPDHLRTEPAVVRFVQAMVRAGKLIAAVCHGPQLLIEAEAVDHKTVTSWPSLRTDLINAGAKWVDRDVVIDGNLVTSRKPDDLDAFAAAIQERLGEPTRQHAAPGAR